MYVLIKEMEVVDVGEDSWVAKAFEEGIHRMMDRGRGTEHTEVSIVHSGNVAKRGGTSIQWLSIHW